MNSYRKISFILSVVSFLLGCAGISTKGDLPPINNFPRTHSDQKTITVRFVKIYDAGKKYSIVSDKFVEELILKRFKNSDYFSDINIQSLAEEHIGQFNFHEKNKSTNPRKIEFPVSTDYFMEISSKHRHPGNHGGGYMHWGLIHYLSLGLIPVWLSNDIDWIVDLYEKNGNKIQKYEIHDDSSTWYWSPLILFNGFKFGVRSEELRSEAISNGIDDIIHKISVNGITTK